MQSTEVEDVMKFDEVKTIHNRIISAQERVGKLNIATEKLFEISTTGWDEEAYCILLRKSIVPSGYRYDPEKYIMKALWLLRAQIFTLSLTLVEREMRETELEYDTENEKFIQALSEGVEP